MYLFDKMESIFNIDEEMNIILEDINKKFKKIKITDSKKRKNLIIKSKIRSNLFITSN